MQTAVIPFEGVNLVSVKDEKTGDVYVALKPIVEGLVIENLCFLKPISLEMGYRKHGVSRKSPFSV